MTVNIKKLNFLPFCVCAILLLHVVVSFNAFASLQIFSYLVWATELASVFLFALLFFTEGKISVFGILVTVYYMLLTAFTFINGNDVKGVFYDTADALLLILLFAYYQENIKVLIISSAIILSVIIYVNLIVMILFPNWMFQAKDVFDSYLLGGNYNQIGCRLLAGLVVSVISVKYSKWWILNTVILFIVSIITLLLVGSMTSLSNIIIFLLFCIIPSNKIRKIGIISFFAVYLIFQFFVVFNGEGLHNVEFARYIIEDVLQKDITFTNRTYLWDAAGRLFANSPIIGYGRVDNDWYIAHLSSIAIGPHNFIYGVLINGGVSLLLVMIAIAWTALRKTINKLNTYDYLLLSAIVTLLFMMTMEVYPAFFLLFMLAIMFYGHLNNKTDSKLVKS